MHLLRRIMPGPCTFEVDANSAVEATLFHQAENQRLLLGLLNMQDKFPAIPVGSTIRIQVPTGHKAKRVLLLPEKKEIRFEEAGPYVQFDIAEFSTFAMAMIEYG
jgi:hypothetical protein